MGSAQLSPVETVPTEEGVIPCPFLIHGVPCECSSRPTERLGESNLEANRSVVPTCHRRRGESFEQQDYDRREAGTWDLVGPEVEIEKQTDMRLEDNQNQDHVRTAEWRRGASGGAGVGDVHTGCFCIRRLPHACLLQKRQRHERHGEAWRGFNSTRLATMPHDRCSK